MGNSKMIRVSITLDEYLTKMAAELSIRLGRSVTKTEASEILAAQSRQASVMFIKKRGKTLGLGSRVIYL